MNLIFKIALTVFVISFLSCKGNQNSPDGNEPVNDTTETKTIYTCPMHPAILTDTAGNCPECGMNLEPRI